MFHVGGTCYSGNKNVSFICRVFKTVSFKTKSPIITPAGDLHFLLLTFLAMAWTVRIDHHDEYA